MNKKLFLGIFLSFLFLPVLVFAGTEHNVSGWAWSETIGWISFNNTSGGGAVNYGVNIGSDSVFSGYAWSENIGWISFAPDGLYPEAPDYSARLDISNNQVTGWARALAYGDGWDGWIKMSGTATDGSTYGVSRSGCDLTGFAWGSDVIGWIKFKGTAQNGSSYGVVITFCENQPPSADNLQVVKGDYCYNPAHYFSWIYSDSDNDNQSQFRFQVDNNSDFTSPEVDRTFSGLNNPSPTTDNQAVTVVVSPGTDQIGYNLNWPNPNYYWRVRVWDSQGGDSDWRYPPTGGTTPPGESFATLLHAYPSPNFFLSPQNPAIGEIVTFFDNSKCYSSPGNTEYSCSAGGSISYLWDFDNGQTSTEKSNATTTYAAAGPKTVRLTITDNSLFPAGVCDTTSPVNTGLPLPEWTEIAPF